MEFIESFLCGNFANNSPEWSTVFQALISQNGIELFRSLFQSTTERKNLQSLSNIGFKLVTQFQEISSQYVAKAISINLSPAEKELVVKLILNCKNQRKFKMLLKDISDISNGLQTPDILSTHLL